jgi:hypothetical protein
MAAVQKDELGDRFHRRDLCCGDEKAVRKHDAAAQLAVSVVHAEDAMAETWRMRYGR